MTRPYSPQLACAITKLRADFRGFTEVFTGLCVRKAHLAPAFIATFRRWERETGRSFVAFVHELDPTVPAERAEYQRHRSYQAALYLKRLVDAPETTPSHRQTASPYELLAIVTKSLLPYVQPEAFWSAIEHASRWRDRDITKFKRVVATAVPLHAVPNQPRLVKRPAA